MAGWGRAPEGCWDVLERFTKQENAARGVAAAAIFKVNTHAPAVHHQDENRHRRLGSRTFLIL